MKNSIFKSYTKKILKSEAVISIMIVFVLALGIIGTSYALYMDVDTDTDYQLVKTGDLSISLQDGTDIISLEEIIPLDDDDVANGTASPTTYTFSIMNTGTYDALYDIKLELLSGNTVDKKDISFLLCKEMCPNTKEELKKHIRSLDELEDMLIHSDRILKGTDSSDTYIIKIWPNSNYAGDADRSLQLKLVVEAKNEGVKYLANELMYDTRIKKNEGTPTFTGAETEEVGMYSAEDDYGTSWYFRGKQSYNYVKFAGFTWRIVRINGDGSIRLILDGVIKQVTREGDTSPVYTNPKLWALGIGRGAFNTNIDDNASVGYMYGNIPSTSYDDAHQNINSSVIKTYLEAFYEEYISSYESYISDTLFCGDKTTASDGTNGIQKHLGYGQYNTVYAANVRLWNNAVVLGEANPTLECAKGATNTYSRYTSKIDMSTKTSKNVEVNNDLEYPIALLSADEAVMAGAYTRQPNTSYYLYDAFANGTSNGEWWTMSPFEYLFSENLTIYAREFIIDLDSSSTSIQAVYTNDQGYRPVINLKSDVVIKNGDGTEGTPYELFVD